MNDYISREALIDRLNKNLSACNPGTFSEMCYADAIETVKHLPAADVEPVRYGRWEGYTHSFYCGTNKYGEPIYRDGTVYYCSDPKCRRKTVIKEKFCPNCGAKMDLEGENNDD